MVNNLNFNSMQKLLNVFFVLSLIFAISCNNNSNKQSANNKTENLNVDKNSNAKLEIIYFHATNRCITCNAVENNAKSLLNESFKPQLEKGEVTFRSLNIDEAENNALTEKFQISFSSLLLIHHQNGKDEVSDFTETAFKYAKNQADKYKDLLKTEINKILTN